MRFLLFLFTTFLMGCSGTRPLDIGVKNGFLKNCPETPNCISSQANPSDNQHFMPPLQMVLNPEFTREKILKIVSEMKRTEVIVSDPLYLHVEFTSALWRFVDDVEFWLDTSANLVHFRSASRLGNSDLGVNRKRMETFVESFSAD